MMFGSFFSAPFNPNAANGMGGFQTAANNRQPQQGGQPGGATSPFGISSPVFPQGLSGQGMPGVPGMPGVSGMPGGAQGDPLAQIGLASMSGDTQMLFLTIQTMMVGIMGMIASVLAGILNGSISGQAPAGSGGGLPGGGTSSVSGGGTPGGSIPGGDAPISGNIRTPGAGNFGGTQLNEEQTRNAAIIASVGQEMGMSKKDIQVAIATAMQESSLKNLNHGDRDSLGLFQQRPSQGWGTPAQVTDPRYAARKFFEGLKKQGNRESRPLTELAQAVQRSAYPDAYAKWAGMAGELVNAMVG